MKPLILVFDDDLVRHPDFLGALPARFVYRADADHAEEDIAEIEPDLVLMDFSMGAMRDGAMAVQALRLRWSLEELPIIGISSDARMNRRMLEVGATDAVVKMAVPESFGALLQHARARR